jgi:Na+-transporting NADH:ubiquinone oxidoreductase subunit NqrD
MMNEKKKKAVKETLVTVFTGLIINWPISLGFLYLCIDILDLSTLNTSIVITIGMTVVALLRVFTIRMHYSKDD